MNKRYRYSSGVLFHQMKQLMKDCDRGMIDREQAADRLRLLCDKLEDYKDEPEQISLFDLQERIQQHLGRR